MRRILLIVFQSLSSIVAFGFAAEAFVSTLRPVDIDSAVWIGRFRALCLFAIGVLLIIFAFRNLLRMGKAYSQEELK